MAVKIIGAEWLPKHNIGLYLNKTLPKDPNIILFATKDQRLITAAKLIKELQCKEISTDSSPISQDMLSPKMKSYSKNN